MVAPLVPWQDFAGPAVLLVGLAAVLFALAIRARRDREGREVVARLLTLGIVLLVIAIPFAVITYRQYVAINTSTYGYRLELRPNGTARDAIILPIPGDEILISGLRVLSGVANWSIVDTGHGRGLSVEFTGNVSLESSYSVFGESRFNHNDTPTMRENASSYEADVWIYHDTASEVRFDLSIDWCRLSAYPIEGWRTYHVVCVPGP
jgi:hypothetical protein